MADLLERPVAFVDGGTTQTRVWVCRGDQVIGQAKATVGARDVARTGSREILRKAVEDLLVAAAVQAGFLVGDLGTIVGAGMIGSPQGLVEVPHVAAPADAAALAKSVGKVSLAGVNVPLHLIPGVRCGPVRCTLDDVDDVDVMRGEETLALGLWATGKLHGGGTLLNLGSHWKAIWVDAAGRIMGSVSTLSGEMVHAVHTQTILASALPVERPVLFDVEAVAAGGRVARTHGLARAFYCVRLLELRGDGTPESRYAFLMGAIMAADRSVLLPAGAVGRVVIASAPQLAEAWMHCLRGEGLAAQVLSEDDIAAAFRAGCLAVLSV